MWDVPSKRGVCVLQLVFALAVPCARAQSQTPNPKAVEIKLEQYGWQRLPSPARHEAWPTEANLFRVDSKGRVLIGYAARESRDLATRGNPILSFHILRFTPEGKLDLSVSLPTDNLPHNAVFLDAEDHIFVVANEMLQMLMDNDQTPTQQRTWKALTPCSWSAQNCQIIQSPTRQKLFVMRCLGPNPNCEKPSSTAYDTSSSEPQVAESCAWRGGRATDRFGYVSGWDREYSTRRYPLCEPDLPKELPLEDPVCAVLTDNLFVTTRVNNKRWELGTVSSLGDTQFRVQLPKHDSPALNIVYVKGDMAGDRFAIVIDTFRGGSTALDIGGHLAARRVAVYSSKSGAQLTSLDIYPPVRHYGVVLGIVPGFAFDLSPDGRVLTVLSEGVVTIARVE